MATNAEYVRRRVHTAKVDEHSEKLLLELIAEKRLGRVIGPTRPPAWLHRVRETTFADHQDVDTINSPPGDIFLAASFPVCQTDENGELKVRRAEDWRRSGHNSTVSVADVPTHHFVGSFVDLARRMAHDRRQLVVFGHDLLNAYRQWPVRRPAHCGTFLATKHGVTFWFHLAMNFGATASVWNFNRAADALQQLLRGLLLTPTGHYVDDFNGVEDADLGESAADRRLPGPVRRPHPRLPDQEVQGAAAGRRAHCAGSDLPHRRDRRDTQPHAAAGGEDPGTAPPSSSRRQPHTRRRIAPGGDSGLLNTGGLRRRGTGGDQSPPWRRCKNSTRRHIGGRRGGWNTPLLNHRRLSRPGNSFWKFAADGAMIWSEYAGRS